MKKIQSQSTSNPASISQAAAVAAINGLQDFIPMMVKAFKERHDYVVTRLNTMPGIETLATDGTFYCFPRVDKAFRNLTGITNDVEFSGYLLNQVGVAVVPGSAFGMPGHIRISIATAQANLTKALDRIEQALKQ
jgi:aspartate aminotransferase